MRIYQKEMQNKETDKEGKAEADGKNE